MLGVVVVAVLRGVGGWMRPDDVREDIVSVSELGVLHMWRIAWRPILQVCSGLEDRSGMA
jgi:hypothetical protein